ncbi:MAG: Amt family ammonium transporter [Rhodothermales bacterium]
MFFFVKFDFCYAIYPHILNFMGLMLPAYLVSILKLLGAAQETAVDTADTAWLLVSTALVLLMTPALAFFYGGLVRSKNALNTMMMSFVSLGVATVLWVVLGYSLAFGEGGAWIGDFSMAFLTGVGGFIGQMGALDFAGGAVVHINAAAAALVAATMLGPRANYGRQALLPHHVPFVLLGSGLLWFGWFGFNAGSALAADGLAA